MNQILTVIVGSLLLSCSASSDKTTRSARRDIPDFNVAAIFINDYVRFLNKQFDGETDTASFEWIQQHPLLSDRFKSTYKKLIDEALKADPELGLDFDPILDAQDYPEDGYEIKKRDTVNNYVIISTKEHLGFHLPMKLIKYYGRWLVDGSGVINIPIDKRVPE